MFVSRFEAYLQKFIFQIIPSSPGSLLLRIGIVARRAPVDACLLLNLRLNQDNSEHLYQLHSLTIMNSPSRCQRIMGNGDGPRYSFYQSFVCLLDVTQVGDVEQDVLHESGWARVCVSGRQHHILLSVHPWVDRLQLVQNAKL